MEDPLASRPDDGNAGRRRSGRRWRSRLAELMRAAAARIDPAPPPARPRPDPRLGAAIMIPGFGRLDQAAWRRGEVKVRFRATDPVWIEARSNAGMVGLREHARRLCVAAHELSMIGVGEVWTDVPRNLELAHSLTDVFADTDIDDTGMLCGPAADYEEADSELAAKHLAATIVFTLVWTAYECAVDGLAPGAGGRGAKGRDLVAAVAPDHLPHLRETLLRALALDPGGTDHGTHDMRRMLSLGSIAGLSGEHLRQFRNRSMHGDLPKPEPGDWGAASTYRVDADPRLLRFQANTRLTLLLIQILAASDVETGTELEAVVEEPCDARLLLSSLHRDGDAGSVEDGGLQLDLKTPDGPTFKRMWR